MALTIKGQPLWTAIGAAALVSFILLAAGFALAVIDFFHPSSPSPKPTAIAPEEGSSADESKVLVSLGIPSPGEPETCRERDMWGLSTKR